MWMPLMQITGQILLQKKKTQLSVERALCPLEVKKIFCGSIFAAVKWSKHVKRISFVVLVFQIIVQIPTGWTGSIFEISIGNNFLIITFRPWYLLRKKCPYGGTFCLRQCLKIVKNMGFEPLRLRFDQFLISKFGPMVQDQGFETCQKPNFFFIFY